MACEAVTEGTKLLAHVRESMAQQDQWTLATVDLHKKEMLELTKDLLSTSILQRAGLAPYLQSPDSRVRAEIEAVMGNLKLTREQAVEYIRQSIQLNSGGS